jgi:hypothetical protein
MDEMTIASLNPDEKKWLAMGIFLAIPIRQHIFSNTPFSIAEFKHICDILECDKDPSMTLSFNKFEISSEKFS